MQALLEIPVGQFSLIIYGVLGKRVVFGVARFLHYTCVTTRMISPLYAIVSVNVTKKSM